jgi:hypothetical protein
MALVVTAIIGLGIIPVQAAEKKAEPKKQTTCPVMGGKINKAQYADVEGHRIYVCCPGCIGKIKAEPAKYIKQLKAQGVELEKAPATKGEKSSTDHGHHAH